MALNVAMDFDDGAAYERFMGAWSQAAGAIFLDWISPLRHARWLEIGCGTGAFTELLLGTCSPARVDAIEPAPALIAYAKRRVQDPRVAFLIGDANRLPFRAASFDVVASALVLNFVADRGVALQEMCRARGRAPRSRPMSGTLPEGGHPTRASPSDWNPWDFKLLACRAPPPPALAR